MCQFFLNIANTLFWGYLKVKFAQTFFMFFCGVFTVVIETWSRKRKQSLAGNHTSIFHHITQLQLGKDQKVQPLRHSIYASDRRDFNSILKSHEKNYCLDRYLHLFLQYKDLNAWKSFKFSFYCFFTV